MVLLLLYHHRSRMRVEPEGGCGDATDRDEDPWIIREVDPEAHASLSMRKSSEIIPGNFWGFFLGVKGKKLPKLNVEKKYTTLAPPPCQGSH